MKLVTKSLGLMTVIAVVAVTTITMLTIKTVPLQQENPYFISSGE